MTTTEPSEVNRDTVQKILDLALTVARDHGADIEAEVRKAAEIPLDQAAAERLYTRILVIVRGADSATLTGTERTKMLDEIRQEAELLVAKKDRPGTAPKAVELIARNGLPVRDVRPMPYFNGTHVSMTEGYVDVLTLDPWDENHRVTLYVSEFKDRHGRLPDHEELLGILQGTVALESGKADPFGLRPLAQSIARKGVERPPIITTEGVPHDGNRRIAASRLVLSSDEFSADEKERARWIRVWQAPQDVTPEQLNAIVVALNFEEDHKRAWPEFVKARLVVDEFRSRIEGETKLPSEARKRTIRKDVASKFAIKPGEVSRYLRMVQWADDFIDYHREAGKPQADIDYRTDAIFQWFYEIEAGPTGSKVTEQFDSDPELRAMTYDLMYDSTFESGAQVRAMHLVAGDDAAYKQLLTAHQIRETSQKEAQELIKDAINDARQRNRAKKALGLDQYVRGIIDRLGQTPATAWETFDDQLLKDLRRTLMATLGAVEGELSVRVDGLSEH